MTKEKDFIFTDEDFKFIIEKVKTESGISLTDKKRDMVYGRLSRRLRELGMVEFKEYLKFIETPQGKDEMSSFINAVTTNLTSFFREKHHFDHLKEQLVKINKPSSKKRIRIWSSASSSGPEPYSIAMIAREAIPSMSLMDFKILATDIDTNMLDACKKGEYDNMLFDKIPEEYRRKYTTKPNRGSSNFAVSDKLKSLITFKQLNLLHNWPMKGPFDFIFCRNVVIYFDNDTKIELFDKMANLMEVGGILYIGHSESLFKISDRFETVGKTIYRKIK